jgi:hypothetical protein
VLVLSCKAWQRGFDPASKLREISEGKIVSGRAAWKCFRERCQPKWSEVFLAAVERATGTNLLHLLKAYARPEPVVMSAVVAWTGVQDQIAFQREVETDKGRKARRELEYALTAELMVFSEISR